MNLLAALVLLVAGCDPGWGYRVPGGKEVRDAGRRFELAGPSHTTLRAHASLFTSTLSTHLTIANDGPSTLEVRPDDLHMADRHGHELPRKTVRPGPVRCDGTNADVVQLAAGSACDLFAEFEVRPDADQLRTITLTLDGITRDAAAVPVRVVFEKG